MKIAIDARLFLYRRGIGNYLSALLEEYVRLTHGHEFVLYVDSQRTAAALRSIGDWHVRNLGGFPYPVWEQWALPQAVARDHPDVLHCPANTGPLWCPSGTRLVVTIHDTMFMMPSQVVVTAGTAYQSLGRTYRCLVTPRVARKASTVITVSEASFRDIVTYCRLTPGKLRLVREAAQPSFRKLDDSALIDGTRGRYGLGESYVLALGALDPRKNTKRVIEAYLSFSREYDGRSKLLLVGLSDSAQRWWRQVSSSLGLESSVQLAGFVPQEDLVALYNGAMVFVYPSLYEGFGLPILEAMACGVPVVTSSRGSIPEVAGDAAVYVNPEDSGSIAAGMLTVVKDGALSQRLVRKGLEQSARFSWKSAAVATLDVYELAGAGVVSAG